MFTRMRSWISRLLLRPTLLWVLVGLNAGGILLAGLNTAGFEFRNDTEWLTEGSGIEFGEHGLAYTDGFTTHDGPGQQIGHGFTVEIALRPDEMAGRGFRFIAVVHSGEDDSQFLIAQWRDTIIVMNGDDYDHRRRSPRLTAAIPDFDLGPFLLVVTSDARGSAVSINGETVAAGTDLTFALPTDTTPGRLVLGNSVYGNSPWRGTIAGFALHPVALSDETLQHHLDLWNRNQGFSGGDYASADLSYPLSERTEGSAADRSANGIDLQFPRETTLVEPRLFSGIETIEQSDVPDVVINLCGFIPFGFFVVALLSEVTRMTRLPALAATLAIGLALSLGIESAQAWIPSRSSDLLDLLLNVGGMGVGAAAFAVVSQPKKLSRTR